MKSRSDVEICPPAIVFGTACLLSLPTLVLALLWVFVGAVHGAPRPEELSDRGSSSALPDRCLRLVSLVLPLRVVVVVHASGAGPSRPDRNGAPVEVLAAHEVRNGARRQPSRAREATVTSIQSCMAVGVSVLG